MALVVVPVGVFVVEPPFSNTGISEWHNLEACCENLTHVPPFSNTGISEWHANRLPPCNRERPPFSNTGISEWHQGRLANANENATRHSVIQASASGTTIAGTRQAKQARPPFSNTGISEWHIERVEKPEDGGVRHSVTQASASGTWMPPPPKPLSQGRHSVTQASASGTAVKRFGFPFFLPPFSNTGISEWHQSDLASLTSYVPPFSNTGISEWHQTRTENVHRGQGSAIQ